MYAISFFNLSILHASLTFPANFSGNGILLTSGDFLSTSVTNVPLSLLATNVPSSKSTENEHWQTFVDYMYQYG